jgi:hypothetical protein
MAWSASQGWSFTDSRPVNTTPAVPASSTTAPSRGWPSAPRPADARSAADFAVGSLSMPVGQ